VNVEVIVEEFKGQAFLDLVRILNGDGCAQVVPYPHIRAIVVLQEIYQI
jgi:hypothetical protein